MPPQAVQAWFNGRTPQTAYGAAALARALIQRGQMVDAADMLRTAWRDTSFDRDQDEEAFYAEFASYLRPTDNLARLDRVLWKYDETAARRIMPLVDDGHRALAEARIALWQGDFSAPTWWAPCPRRCSAMPGSSMNSPAAGASSRITRARPPF